MRIFTGAVCTLCAAALACMLTSGVSAQQSNCDFLTGGGYIFTTASNAHPVAKATFAIAGGCRDGSPTWGHAEYSDESTGLNVHWTRIVAYLAEGPGTGDTSTDPQTGQPTGTRLVCGTAQTNIYGDVDFMARAFDAGEPGTSDLFDIRLSVAGHIVYSTENEVGGFHKLGDGSGGGNVQLHRPNSSTTGFLSGTCPARAATF